MEWISKRLEWSRYKVSHTSDVLRVALLWRFGGTYLDTDMMVLRSFPDILDKPNIIVQENHRFSKQYACNSKCQFREIVIFSYPMCSQQFDAFSV